MSSLKFLSIVGPTASGKTSLAAYLASQFNGELISADSRQVYQGMDIITGKDIGTAKFKPQPKLQKKLPGLQIGTYEINAIPIWGLDLVKPDIPFDVSTFVKLAKTVIRDIHSRRKLPIIVGGTGFYHKALLKPPQTLGVPQDTNLRQKLRNKTTDELKQKLQKLAPAKFQKLNQSDQNNPRRLVRAIEVATFLAAHTAHAAHAAHTAHAAHATHKDLNQPQRHSHQVRPDPNANYQTLPNPDRNANYQTLYLGLNLPLDSLEARIYHRTQARIKLGAEEEIKKLIKAGYSWDLPSMTTLGYQEWRQYLEGKLTKEELVSNWTQSEFAYAKRQLTWFKKQPDIHWLTANSKDLPIQAKALVQKLLKTL
jgi:tRNA dimethylallyltransferase